MHRWSALVCVLGLGAAGATIGANTPRPFAVAALDTVVVFGPMQFDGSNGQGQTYVEQFTTTAADGRLYTLRLVNGAADGTRRASKVIVKVNGFEVVSQNEVTQSVAELTRPVSVTDVDTIRVTVAGSGNPYATLSILSTADSSFNVAGPTQYDIPSGTTKSHTYSFSLPTASAPPHRLYVVNGSSSGMQRVTSASVSVNGTTVVSTSELTNAVGSLTKVVSLSASNTINLTLNGPTNSYITVRFTATDTTRPTLTIVAPMQNAVVAAGSVAVSGTVEDQTAAGVTINGAAATVTGTAYSGTATLTAEGSNLITVRATDASGRFVDSTRTVFRDTQAPALTVSAPLDNMFTRLATVEVAANASDATALTVNTNGTPLTAGSGGSYTGAVAVVEGSNILATTATDAAGNLTSVVRTVFADYTPPALGSYRTVPRSGSAERHSPCGGAFSFRRQFKLNGQRVMDLSSVSALTERLDAAYLEYHGVLPMAIDGDELDIATWRDAVDPQVLDDLALLFEARPSVRRLPEELLRDAIQRVYGAGQATAEGVIAGLTADAPAPAIGEAALDDLVSLANEAPVVKLVNLLLLEALEARASDVHLEGYADSLRVRYRVDGVLQEAASPPAQFAAAVVSRLKIMAELDIAERRVPQDGRIRLRLQDRQVDVRVSTLPTLHGESVVLRLLDKERGWGALGELGMSSEVLDRFVGAISKPHGIVLTTGPTGSGKTTTLYAAIDRIRSGREKILTVEDPVEYELVGVPQVPVNEKVGVTFATALRALLRQDPDVMLVGEIRDGETAEIATNAALTGHLVLSTLHTNDAAGALTRLLDLDVPAYLVSSTVEAVLAQRLVRRNCLHCTRWAPAAATDIEAMGGGDSVTKIARGTGCLECRGTGFRGRTGIYELLVMDDSIRSAVVNHRPAAEIRAMAEERGMKTLWDDGRRLVLSGATTPEEVIRGCGASRG